MPRSKRKAKAAAVGQDFQKKKPKLGRKARADNFTNTTVKQKQVFVPDQSRSEQQLASTQTGLSLTDLLSRTRHHNAKTRAAAFNALTNALKSSNALAHSAMMLSPAPAINAAAVGIADENACARRSARTLFVSAWSGLPDVQPFRAIFATALLACLSHIRLGIRLDGARTLVELLRSDRMPSAQLFADTANPLESICHMLFVSSAFKGRADIMEAISSLCQDCGSEQDAQHGRPRREADAVQVTLEKRRSLSSFSYHRPRRSVPQKQSGQLIAKLPTNLASRLMKRVAQSVSESFPLVATRKDVNMYGLYLSASQALYTLVVNCSSQVDHKAVHRCLKLWCDDDGDSHISTADIHLALTAIHLKRFDACHDFVMSALRLNAYPSSFDECVAHYIEKSDDNSDVLEAWCERFEKASREGNTNFLYRSLRMCEVVFRQGSTNRGMELKLLESIPFAIKACVNDKAECAHRRQSVSLFVKLFCNSYRSLRAKSKIGNSTVMEKVVDIVCTQRLALNLGEREVDEIVGVLVAAEMITADEVVSFIGYCYREGKLHLAERFLMGAEAVAVGDGNERYRAVALVRALKRMKSAPNESLRAQLDRIESAVC